MATLLLVETSGDTCSVAISNNKKILAFKESSEGRNHSSLITLYIEEVIKKAGILFNDIDAVAVNGGPGSYTGLRIGLTTAKGLCFALDIPLIIIDTMSSLCAGLINSIDKQQLMGKLICPVIDNRRDEIFYALFNPAGELLKGVSITKTGDTEFLKLIETKKLIFTGSGTEKTREVAGGNHTYISIPLSATYLLEPAEIKFKNGAFANLAYSEPLYYKEVYINGISN